jgi:hypothetical protein
VKRKIIEMRTDMSVTCEDISFAIFSEVSCDIILDLFLMKIFALIDTLDSIFLEKFEYLGYIFTYKEIPLFPIESVEVSLLCEASIPEVEIFSFCFSFSDFFEQCISLAHDGLIFSLHDAKLMKSPIEYTVYVVTPD